MTDRTEWAAASQAVDEAQSILIATHISPDGDAIGSLLGLGNALRLRGCSVTCVVDGGVPGTFRFLPGADEVRDTPTSGQWDLMISVDSSDEERTGQSGVYGRAHSARVINLDHHITNTHFGDIFLVMPSAVSATEVVYHWLHEWQQPLALEVAVPLLTGLVTDTLGFRTSNVTANSMRMAVELMEIGAPLAEITQRTLSSMSYRVLDLWKHSLATVQLHDQVIEATITQADLHAVGLDDVTDGGLVQLLVTINEARIAVVFKEVDSSNVEISLRSRPGYDVAQVAFSLGGGGHPQASGATVDGTLNSVRERVLPLLQAVTFQNNSN